MVSDKWVPLMQIQDSSCLIHTKLLRPFLLFDNKKQGLQLIHVNIQALRRLAVRNISCAVCNREYCKGCNMCKRLPLAFACLISSSVISMRFFLKATTRLPLKMVSSVGVTRSSSKCVAHWNKHSNRSTLFMCQHTNLSSQTQRACQISAGTAAGAPQPVGCPCSSVEPYPRPCLNSHSLLMPGRACRGGPGQQNRQKLETCQKTQKTKTKKNYAIMTTSRVLLMFFPL